MTPVEKRVIEEVYRTIKEQDTVLGFDEKRGVGVIAICDERQEDQLRMVPVAEIPTLMGQSVSE